MSRAYFKVEKREFVSFRGEDAPSIAEDFRNQFAGEILVDAGGRHGQGNDHLFQFVPLSSSVAERMAWWLEKEALAHLEETID